MLSVAKGCQQLKYCVIAVQLDYFSFKYNNLDAPLRDEGLNRVGKISHRKSILF